MSGLHVMAILPLPSLPNKVQVSGKTKLDTALLVWSGQGRVCWAVANFDLDTARMLM